MNDMILNNNGMKNVCCFIGHREIDETQELKTELWKTIEMLIVGEGVDTFLFGSKSRFNSLCYEIVTQIREKFPHIRRIYVRGEFPVIDDAYKTYLLEKYEDTFYPEGIVGAGPAVYVERNYEMIKKSKFCIFYFREDCTPKGRKSGTRTALNYAIKRHRKIYTFPFLRSEVQDVIKG